MGTLSPTVDFLAAQLDKDSKRRLTTAGMGQLDIILGANITPTGHINIESRPSKKAYMHYAYIDVADTVLVPGSVSIIVQQYGGNPFGGVLYPSALGYELGTVLRVLQGQPVITDITNLTPLNQHVVIYTLFLEVQNEADYNELERRLSDWYAARTPVVAAGA
jgi:hypothetical protein